MKCQPSNSTTTTPVLSHHALGEKELASRKIWVPLRNSDCPAPTPPSALLGDSNVRTLAGIGLANVSTTKHFRRIADLRCNGCNPCSLQRILGASFADHAYSALDDFGGVLWLPLYSSIRSSNGGSSKSGEVQAPAELSKARIMDLADFLTKFAA